MWWTNPFWLLALVFVIPVLWLGGFTLNAKKQPKSANSQGIVGARAPGNYSLKRLTVLRAAAVIAVVLSLAGTSVLIPTKNRQLVILLDISASIEEYQIEESRNAALRIIKELNSSDTVAVVAFAGQPTIITPLVKPEEAVMILESAIFKPVQPEQTDLQAALHAGFELLKERRGNRSIFLFSDGHPTSGGMAITTLREHEDYGIPVYAVPLDITNVGFITNGLKLPEIIHRNEKIQAQWEVTANTPQNISSEIKIDGKIIQKTQIHISKGVNNIPLIIDPQDSGIHRIEVEAADMNGKSIPPSAGGGLLQVSGPARVLVIHGDSSSALSRALEIQGMQVTTKGLNALPDFPGVFDAYAAVVLDNVPALYLTENQQNLLQNYVATGGGLLVVGGESSLGRGEYYATRLGDMLPVQTDTRQRLIFPRAEILFIIDHSGSMSENVGKTSKQLVAMQGVKAAIKELRLGDEIGILSFDTKPTWALHLTPVTERAVISKALSNIGEGGGTDMSVAIQEVIHEFSTPGPIRRHIIILSDGLTFPGKFQELSLKLKSLGVTITTIAIGDNVNEKLLRDISRWGEGQYYRAALDRIPQIFQKETIRITRDLIQEGSFKPRLLTAAASLKGLDNLPPVKGYLITKPKELATVYIQVKNDPLLAGWQYGNGQVMVFTSDSGRRWLASWSETQDYNRFWSQILRSLERASRDQGLLVSVKAEAANAHITVEALDLEHRLRTGLHLVGYTDDNLKDPFNFKETAPGRYEANVPLTGFGIQQFKIYDPQSKLWGEAWVWNPPGAELSGTGADLSALRQISATTGGNLLNIKNAKSPALDWKWAPLSLKNWFIILALLLFLIELGYRSTLLGQLGMARAVITAWWEFQTRLRETVYRESHENNISGNNTRQSSREAYRFLAERARQRRNDG